MCSLDFFKNQLSLQNTQLDAIGRGPPMQRHGYVVGYLRVEANAEQEKDTVTMMMTVFRILNVEQEIAKTKILFLIFQLVPTAAMTLFQVRCSKNYMSSQCLGLKLGVEKSGVEMSFNKYSHVTPFEKPLPTIIS